MSRTGAAAVSRVTFTGSASFCAGRSTVSAFESFQSTANASPFAVTGAAAAKFSAVDLAKAAVLAMGGQGAGGRPDFAQGGAPDGAKANEGLAAIKGLLGA